DAPVQDASRGAGAELAAIGERHARAGAEVRRAADEIGQGLRERFERLARCLAGGLGTLCGGVLGKEPVPVPWQLAGHPAPVLGSEVGVFRGVTVEERVPVATERFAARTGLAPVLQRLGRHEEWRLFGPADDALGLPD